MKVKYYIAGIFSILALVFYYLPWTNADERVALDLYSISFFWFMVAWVALIIHLFFCIRLKVENDQEWKHHLVASSLIIISYVGLFIMIFNGYIVTV